MTSFEPWPSGEVEAPRAAARPARERGRPRGQADAPSPRPARPGGGRSPRRSRPKRSAQPDRLREVAGRDLAPRAPCARSASTTGRRTRTCGLLVRSTQTRTGRGGVAFAGRVVATLGRLVLAFLVPLASLTDPLVDFATNVVGDLGLRGRLRPHAARERVHPDPERGDDAVRRLQRLRGPVQPDRGDARRLRSRTSSARGSPTRVGYYGRVDILEKHGRKLHIKPSHLAVGRPLVRAPRRRDRLLHAHAADHPHVHLAAGRRRADAVLALHASSRSPGCLPWVFLLAFIGKQVGANWEDWKDSLHYVDYAVVALIVVGVVLPRRAQPARPQAPARGRGGCAGR